MIRIDTQGITTTFSSLLGDSIREAEPALLGDPRTGQVVVPEDLSDQVGMYYIHDVSASDPLSGDAIPLSVGQALLTPNKIAPAFLIYGTPVLVRRIGRQYHIVDLDGVAAVEFLFGIHDKGQGSINLYQFDYGLMRPNTGEDMRVIVSAARYVLDGTAYNVPALLSVPLSTYFPFPFAAGDAISVKVEVDPVTATLHYEASSAFTNASHESAFAAYPNVVTENRFLAGWVKLYQGMTAITLYDIYPAQEVLNKSGGGSLDMAAIASRIVVSSCGDVVTSGGEIVWTEEV